MTIGLYTDRTARGILRQLQELRQRVGIGRPDRPPPVVLDDGLTFKNTSATTIPPYGLVRVDDELEFNDTRIYEGKYPDTTWGDEWLINGPDEVAQNDFGTAQAGPIVTFLFDTGTPAAKAIYGPKPGQAGASLGFPALLKVIGVYDQTAKLCRGRLLHGGVITTLLGKTTAAAAASTPTTDWIILAETASGTNSDAGFTTVPSAVSRVAIDDDKEIEVTMLGNGWRMKPLECNG
ncbi:MAG: hypothetical protein AB7U73_21885 [Pirellulales bacterium]